MSSFHQGYRYWRVESICLRTFQVMKGLSIPISSQCAIAPARGIPGVASPALCSIYYKNAPSAATHTINVHFVQSTPICLWQSAKSCIFVASKYIMTSKVSKNRGIEQLLWNSNVEVNIFQLRYCLMPFYMLRVCITLPPKIYGK